LPDVIELSDLRFDTIIGILDAEQRAPQPVIVDLTMEVPLEMAARSGLLDSTINYAEVQAWILTLAQQGRWRLLESMAMAICRLILANPEACEGRGAIQAVNLRIRKPTILVGAVPGVMVRREAAWCDLQEKAVATGVVVGTLEQTPTEGAWRVRLAPGAAWHAPASWMLQVLGGELHAGSRRVLRGETVARGPKDPVVAGASGAVVLAVG
jgi:dihydroneopterin aldolase